MGDTPQNIHSVSGSSDHLTRIEHRVGQLRRLERFLLRHIPEPLASHCRLANYRRGVAILHVDSPAWAMRLNYLRPALLSELRQRVPQTSAIEIKVRPSASSTAEPRQQATPTTSRQLSEQAAEYLLATAESAPDTLRQKLEKLAAHARKRHD